MLSIQLDHVGKRYRTSRSRTVMDLIASKVNRLRGHREEIHTAEHGSVDATMWALRDVSLDVPQGAGLGIIGRNGAGKTTLLKLVSRVTWPTQGSVRIGGHVVSLIELGAGFHHELTGRENVYLGAGLFGLTRRETDRCFDAIVDFADVAPLIDTPMKRYSSGLYARLGFAVAIFSRPDIVLVDEVLAVGDAPFRRRAIEALRRLIAEGKTVLFISHDLWNVRRLCTDILWLDKGEVRAYGPAAEITERYMNEVNLAALGDGDATLQTQRTGTGEVQIRLRRTAGCQRESGGTHRGGRFAHRSRDLPRRCQHPAGRVPDRDRRRGHRRRHHDGQFGRRRADRRGRDGSDRMPFHAPGASPASVRPPAVDHGRTADSAV